MRQKAIIVKTGTAYTEGLEALNEALAQGWRVVHSTAMGGAGTGRPAEATLEFAALVVIEQSDRRGEALAAEEAEEDTDEVIDDLVEGNGAGSKLPPDVPPSQN